MMLYSTHTSDLVPVLESASPASCKTPATFIDSIRPNNHPRKNKILKKIKLPTNYNILSLPKYTKPRAKRVDSEPSPKRGGDKINRLRPRRNNTTENKLYCTAWTHKQEPST